MSHKSFKTIQELFSYCLFCPICQDITRAIYILVGPDDTFIISNHKKLNNTLTLNCRFRNTKQRIRYIIDCSSNTFTTELIGVRVSERQFHNYNIPYFYFYIQSDCIICNCSFANGADLEVDYASKSISNIGLERESICVPYGSIREAHSKGEFHISYEYEEGKMYITKCVKEADELIMDDNAMVFDIFDFDFSNIKKVLNKIKTLISFS